MFLISRVYNEGNIFCCLWTKWNKLSLVILSDPTKTSKAVNVGLRKNKSLLWCFYVYGMTSLTLRRSKTPTDNLPGVPQTLRKKHIVRKSRCNIFPVQKQPQEPFLLFSPSGALTFHSKAPTITSPVQIKVLRAEDLAWELLLDAATLKNIIHTFPRRSLLGNTDTSAVPWLWDRWSRTPQYSTMGFTVTVCGWAQVGLDWICRVWVWDTVDLRVSRMWWSCEGV